MGDPLSSIHIQEVASKAGFELDVEKGVLRRGENTYTIEVLPGKTPLGSQDLKTVGEALKTLINALPQQNFYAASIGKEGITTYADKAAFENPKGAGDKVSHRPFNKNGSVSLDVYHTALSSIMDHVNPTSKETAKKTKEVAPSRLPPPPPPPRKGPATTAAPPKAPSPPPPPRKESTTTAAPPKAPPPPPPLRKGSATTAAPPKAPPPPPPLRKGSATTAAPPKAPPPPPRRRSITPIPPRSPAVPTAAKTSDYQIKVKHTKVATDILKGEEPKLKEIMDAIKYFETQDSPEAKAHTYTLKKRLVKLGTKKYKTDVKNLEKELKNKRKNVSRDEKVIIDNALKGPSKTGTSGSGWVFADLLSIPWVLFS